MKKNKINYTEFNTNHFPIPILLSYSPKPFLIRILFVSTISVITLKIILVLMRDTISAPNNLNFKYYVLVILTYNVLTESQIVIDNLLEILLPLPKRLRLRLSIQFVAGFSLLGVAYWISINYIDPKISQSIEAPFIYVGLVIGLLFVNIITNILTISRMTEKWYYSSRQLDIIKQEKMQMDYNLLQDKLNPHFMFNNLSVLRSLIYTDAEEASLFIENLADVYRYVLISSEKQLVRLSEELEFLNSYLDLHRARIRNGLKITVDIPEKEKMKLIAPLTLQLLVENAIKHNIADNENPLLIMIRINKEFIEVSNRINKKENTYSTKTGLKNLQGRYELLNENQVMIKEDDYFFSVNVPLI